MVKVKADTSACQGFGNCVISAPGTFTLDDEGLVVVIAEDVSEEERPMIEDAVRGCPASALNIVRDGGR